MSEEDKPKLGLRPQLGIKRTTEVSQVKQSFSHGRTHKVVVETKKARTFRKPREEAAPVADVAATEEAPAPEKAAPVADAPKMPVAPPPPFVTISDDPVDRIETPAPEAPAAAPAARPETAPVADAPAAVAAAVASDVAATAAPGETKADAASAAPVAAGETPMAEAATPAPAAKAASAAPKARAKAQAGDPSAQPGQPGHHGKRVRTKGHATKAAIPFAAEDDATLSPAQRALRNPGLTPRERQEILLRIAEEDRLKMAEQARIREEREKAEAAEAERQRLEEKAQAEAAEAAKAEAERNRPAAEAPAEESESDDRRGGAHLRSPARRPHDTPKPTRGAHDNARRRGKLTIARALGSDEGRGRSVAAMRRASEKQRRHAHGGGATATQKMQREVQVPEAITVQELANRMAERGADLVKTLFKMGMPTTINATIDQDTAELLVTEFGHIIRRVADSDVEQGIGSEPDAPEDMLPRPPVITIMGHVDHGKTTLLDALRGTGVAESEAGGITQHIGAYQLTLPSGQKISVLDTPGHEAFSEMRARGANATDIVVLVVAADDGIKPQTVEAINHVRAADVPMIVAINKIDKPAADATRVRNELLQQNVQVESRGGDIQDVEVSALRKTGLDELVEKILLQAEILELKANPNRMAEAYVIEAKLDRGRGPVATVLIRRGTLHTGDIFVVGSEWGKVRAILDDRGQTIREATPSQPVEVLGLSGVPKAGDLLSVVESEARAREIASYRQQRDLSKRTAVEPASLESMFANMAEKKAIEFPVVVKADVHGSAEAIVSALNHLSTDEIRVRILHSGVGAITESDVTLAKASGALIIGFNVRANAKAREAAHQAAVPLKYYDIIYDLIDEVKAGMAGKLGPEYFENVVGRADIREVFQASKFGKAAGCMVTEGHIRRNLKARVLRDDVIIYNGSIASLRRYKDDVTQVEKGYECGIGLDNFQDIKVGDVIETYEVEERTREL